jgi:hypothetical protein
MNTMKTTTPRTSRLAATVACWLAVAAAAAATSARAPSHEESAGATSARGTFDVKIEALAEDPFPDGITLGRYSLAKQYHGDLEAEAAGEMLTAGTPVEGSAGYVAIERVEGALHGRRGSFLLQHRGTMGHGEQHLEITVIPDSGTGELVGLAGSLVVTIAGGEHSYALEYTLPD